MKYKIDPTTKLINDYMLRNAEIQHGDLDIESLSYDEILDFTLNYSKNNLIFIGGSLFMAS